jgi:hypothetical protein
MKLEAMTLVLTMSAGILLVAGWDAPEPQEVPGAAVAAPAPAEVARP